MRDPSVNKLIIALCAALVWLLAGCGQNPGAAYDDDVQLALKGVSETFTSAGLYSGDFARNLGRRDWSLQLVTAADLPCSGDADACTELHGDTPHIWAQEGYGWSECPRVPKSLMHEWFHVALKWDTGDADPTHTNPLWQKEVIEQTEVDVCAP